VDALARAILADPHAPPGLTLEQARFDALVWLITGQPATSHPAWPPPASDTDDDQLDEPDHDERPGHVDPDGEAGGAGFADPAAEDVPPWELPDDPGPAARDGAGGDSGPAGGETTGSDETTCDDDGAVGGVGGVDDVDPDVDVDRHVTSDNGGDAGHGAGDPGIFAATAGCGCGRPRVSVGVTAHVTLSLSTLLGLDDAPGELAGSGPVPASVARELAASASTWRRLLTDPVDGHLVTQAIRSYRPTAAVREFVLARAGGVCASRGCTARHGLQIDHDIPWPHGPTSAGNNLPLHQPHHDAKTCGAWCHRLHGDSGGLTQTSPLGRTYTTTPLPPLGELPVPDPDLTAQVRARLHLLHQQIRRRRPGRPHTTGPPHRVHLDWDSYQHRVQPVG
jgi:hypothetical protein